MTMRMSKDATARRAREEIGCGGTELADDPSAVIPSEAL